MPWKLLASLRSQFDHHFAILPNHIMHEDILHILMHDKRIEPRLAAAKVLPILHPNGAPETVVAGTATCIIAFSSQWAGFRNKQPDDSKVLR